MTTRFANSQVPNCLFQQVFDNSSSSHCSVSSLHLSMFPKFHFFRAVMPSFALLLLLCILAIDGVQANDTRIIGGDKSRGDKWSFLAAVFFAGKQSCGGILWSPNYVLTAAHCVCWDRTTRVIRPGPVTVYLGHTNLTTMDHDYHIDVVKIITHRYYNPVKNFMYDIALLKLKSPIEFGGRHMRARCVCYPEPLENIDRERCVSMGWGSTQSGRRDHLSPSLNLLETNVPVLTESKCARWGSFNSHWHVCAMHPDGGHDSCKGDSGGPLVCPVLGTNPPVWSLVGLTSFGISDCGKKGTPGFYTRVNRFLYWIKMNTGDDG